MQIEEKKLKLVEGKKLFRDNENIFFVLLAIIFLILFFVAQTVL